MATILERLRQLGEKKKLSARQQYFAYIRRTAAGDNLSDKELDAFAQASQESGFNESDVQSHINLFAKLRAAESQAAKAPLLLSNLNATQAKIDAIDAQIGELQATRRNLSSERDEASRQYSDAADAAAQTEGLRQEITKLTTD
ncbi:MAG TPA: hypothetical protein VM008_05075 [Phycisphaerae bacterium]|nr:hypothetical protein [Phycisphaerae bacterium]